MTFRKPFTFVGGVALLGTAGLLLGTTVGHAQTVDANASAQSASGPIRLDTAKPAIPSAQEVIVDLPSAFHASRHQRGEINNLRYVLFPDGTGKVMQSTEQRSVLFRLDCTNGKSCSISGQDGSRLNVPADGDPNPVLPASPDGKALAQYLAKWVLVGVEPQAEHAVVTPAASFEEPTPEDLAIVEPTPEKVVSEELMPVEGAPEKVAPETLQPEKQVVARAATNSQNLTSNTEPPAKTARKSIQPDPQPSVPAPATTVRAPAKPTANPLRQPKRPVRKRASVPVYASAKPLKLPAVNKPTNSAKPAKESETFFQRIKLACSITGSVTLRYKNHNTGSERFGKPRASLGCGARLSDKFSLRLSVIGYGDKNEKSPSDAEFTYALTYRATDKVTLTYSNYSARFSDSGNAFADSLTSGTFRASYRLPKLKLPNDKAIGCSASIGLAKPEDTTANLSCSYAVTKKIRIGATAYAHLPGRQQNWDADFSYTASYKINDDWSLSYSNYANNRFFWNKSSSPGEGILGGTLSVTYRFKF